MYRIIFTVLFLSSTLNIAQNLKVIKNEKLIAGDVERLYFPSYSPDGNSIVLTKNNFQGLWLYNISKKELTQLNDYEGSGFEPEFDLNGNINFKTTQFNKNKRKSFVIKTYDTQRSIEFKDSLLKVEQPQLSADQSQIIFIENGESKKLKPLGEGLYIWTSLSPKKDKILFTFAGKGTFICDLNGRITAELGYANAPKWSPDGKWIVYMNDKDDGLNYISSDIFIISADGKLKFNVTNTDWDIEMYPQWSPDGNKIVYNNLAGEIFEAELEFQK